MSFGCAVVAALLGHPHAAVVAQRLRHQGQLRLVLAGDRDAGRVDLRVAGVGEQRAALVRPPRRRDVRALGVRRQVVDVAVAARAEDHGVGQVRLDLPVEQVAGDDPAGLPVDDDQVEHLRARVHLDRAGADLALEGLVRAEQQLLARLPAGVEGARHLRAAERPGVEQARVLAGEGHALRDALVDDVEADLGQAVHVRLARAEVAALDRVVEQPVHRVAVVAVVLRGVDAALGRDRVRAPRAVLVAERLHVVAGLAQRRRRGAAGQAGADDDDAHLAAVGRVHEARGELAVRPPVADRAVRGAGVGDRVADDVAALALGGRGFLLEFGHLHLTRPVITDSGTIAKPIVITAATTKLKVLSAFCFSALLAPNVWIADQRPCRMWRPSATTARM